MSNSLILLSQFNGTVDFSDLGSQEYSHTYYLKARDEQIDTYYPTLVGISILLTLVGVVGTIGNALVIYAFVPHLQLSQLGFNSLRGGSSGSGPSTISGSRGHGSGGAASNLFIILLAMIDIIICLVDIPATLYWTVWQRNAVDIVCKLHVSLKAFFIPMSSYILVLIAADRFMLICFVPGVQMRCRTICLTLLGTCLLGIALAIPMGLHTGVPRPLTVNQGEDTLIGSPRGGGRGQKDMLIDQSFEIETPIDPFPVLRKATTSVNNFPSNPPYINKEVDTVVFGPCMSDQRFIKNEHYIYYLRILLAFFVCTFIAITLLYIFIFTFVWWRQRMWDRRYSVESTSMAGGSRLMKAKKQSLGSKPTLDMPNNTQAHKIAPNHNNNNHKPHTDTEPNNCHRVAFKQGDDECISRTVSCELAANADKTAKFAKGTGKNSRCWFTCVKRQYSIDDVSGNGDKCTKGHDQKLLNEHSDDLYMGDDDVDGELIEMASVISHCNNASDHVTGSLIPERRDSQKTRPPHRNQMLKPKMRRGLVVQSSVRRADVYHSRRRKPHIRTAQTVALITVAFVVSYLPYLLIINKVILREDSMNRDKGTVAQHFRQIIFYLYFLNSAANPIIYSCMNLTFRSQMTKLWQRIRQTIRCPIVHE